LAEIDIELSCGIRKIKIETLSPKFISKKEWYNKKRAPNGALSVLSLSKVLKPKPISDTRIYRENPLD